MARNRKPRHKDVARLEAECARAGGVTVGIAPRYYKSGRYDCCQVVFAPQDVALALMPPAPASIGERALLVVSPDWARRFAQDLRDRAPRELPPCEVPAMVALADDIEEMAGKAETLDRLKPTIAEAQAWVAADQAAEAAAMAPTTGRVQ